MRCDAGDDLVGRVARRGVFVVSTLVHFESITGEAATVDHAGTDANPWSPQHGVAMHRELELLTEAGLTPPQALASATIAPAVRFGLTGRGRVEPGLRADLLLVDGDPTTDITAISAVTDVWRRGVRLVRS